MFPNSERASRSVVIQQIQKVLAFRNLSIAEVSRRSVQMYGQFSPYFIPHNLYFELRRETFSPSIHQILALSVIRNIGCAIG